MRHYTLGHYPTHPPPTHALPVHASGRRLHSSQWYWWKVHLRRDVPWYISCLSFPFLAILKLSDRRKFQARAQSTRTLVYGQRGSQYQWFTGPFTLGFKPYVNPTHTIPVLHHDCCYPLARWQACRLRGGSRRYGRREAGGIGWNREWAHSRKSDHYFFWRGVKLF